MAKAYSGDDSKKAITPGKQKNREETVIDVIVKWANHYKIPPALALAIAQHESGFDTNAVGDNGTSFGIYQLHQGGELPAGKNQKWAADPNNNARIALAEIAAVYHRNPKLDWGTIAALAQRPANAHAYAQVVNDIVKRAGTGQHAYNYYSAAAGTNMTSGFVGTDWTSTHPDIAKVKPAAATPAAPAATSTANNIGFNTSSTTGGSGGGGGGAGAAGASASIGTTTTASDFTAQLNAAGFAKALIDSDPTLKKVFAQAISEGWYKSTTGLDRFQAAIRNTKWWTTRTDTQRTFDERQFGDAKGLQADIGKAYDDLAAQAKTLGIAVSPADLQATAKLVVRNGLSNQEIANSLSAHFNYDPNAAYTGTAGSTIDQIKQLASDYYVPVTDKQMQSWVQQVDAGTLDPKSLNDYFKQQSLSMFPYLKPQLDAGQTVSSVADTYKKMMADTLEVDPAGIANNDPTVMKALQAKDDKGTLGLMPLWQYQQQLKDDPRWVHTQNARDSVMDVGTGLLKQWGLIS